MRKQIGMGLSGLLLGGGLALAAERPQPIGEADLQWVEIPGMSGVRASWALGAEPAEGLYALRVRLGAGGRIPPHTHPDDRYTTVLEGAIWVGFGDTFDERAMVKVTTGQLYHTPAGVPHYVLARSPALYQESGRGPSGTRLAP